MEAVALKFQACDTPPLSRRERPAQLATRGLSPTPGNFQCLNYRYICHNADWMQEISQRKFLIFPGILLFLFLTKEIPHQGAVTEVSHTQ